MEKSEVSFALTPEKRLDFWKAAMVRIARVSKTMDMEIQSLLDVIDGGMVGEDLLSEHGASLITHMLANWPRLETDPYTFETGQANLLDYKPGMTWGNVGPHAPIERVVAALIHAGCNPWRFKMEEMEDGTLTIGAGETYPPIFFALMTDDTPRASFKALLSHPDRPPIEELMRYRDEKGRPLMEIAATRDGFALTELLALGADPNMVGSKNLPLLFHASYRACVQALVSAGAKTDLVDGSGNSLQMHWALKSSSFSSDLITALPKPTKGETYKVSLPGLVASLDGQSKAKVKSLLAAMKTPASYRWQRNGEDVDLLEVIVSEAAFGPVKPKVATLVELINKKNEWPETTVRQLFVIKELFSGRSGSRGDDDAQSLVLALEKRAPDTTPEQAAAAIARMLVVRKALRPTSPLDNLENKVRQEVLFPWNDLLERTIKQDSTGPLALAIFQGYSRAALDVKTVGAFFTDNLFRHMVDFVKANDLPEKDWLFWTAMGINSGSLVQQRGWQVWEESLPNHDPAWFNDPQISRALSFRRDPDLASRLDQIVLRHASLEVEPFKGPSRRL